MTYLLDTNVLSELRKPADRADQAVVEWAVRQRTSQLFVSVITVMEIDVGVCRVERRDPAQGSALRSWLDRDVLGAFAGRVLPIDLEVVRRAAALHVPDPRPDRDALIAATASVRDLVVVTRNVRDFRPLGVEVLDPWAPEFPDR